MSGEELKELSHSGIEGGNGLCSGIVRGCIGLNGIGLLVSSISSGGLGLALPFCFTEVGLELG